METKLLEELFMVITNQFRRASNAEKARDYFREELNRMGSLRSFIEKNLIAVEKAAHNKTIERLVEEIKRADNAEANRNDLVDVMKRAINVFLSEKLVDALASRNYCLEEVHCLEKVYCLRMGLLAIKVILEEGVTLLPD